MKANTLSAPPAGKRQKNGREEVIERIYEDWDAALARSDIDALLDLYAPDAVIESPLVSHLCGKKRGICSGHKELRPFFEILRERKPPIRRHYRKSYFTDGRTVIWEYPRETPKGDQMDFAEAMEINDEGLIQHHNVYWGWFGIGVLERDEYHKDGESRRDNGQSKKDREEPGKKIAGYSYGVTSVGKSPVSLDELEQLKQTVTLSDEDVHQLHIAGDILEDQTDAIVDAWRDVIGKTPHLAYYFTDPHGKPDESYKVKVKERFKQWVLDVCRRPYDQKWLDYQQEIGLRHTHLKKNATEQAATPPHIPLRYLLAFTAVINDRIKPFLTKKGSTPEAVEAMHRAWCKAVILHVTLWSRPYVADSEW